MHELPSQSEGKPIYIFAGGGTGGHLYPGLAVAERLRALCPEARVVFACSRREIDQRILDPTEYAIFPQRVRPLPHRLRDFLPFMIGWWVSRRQARKMVADLQPAAVLGLGGYAAAPMVAAGARAGTPTALLNPDAVPGRANKYLARHVDVVFAQFDSTAGSFPAASRSKVRTVGCPIRPGLLQAQREDAIAHFELDPSRRTLLILGGSLGAASINDAVDALLAGPLPDGAAANWQVLHIAGPGKAADASSPSQGPPVRRLEFCHRMDRAYAAADLAVCRGGASTVAELAATGTPALILPYPHHSDRQQWLNASALVEAGAAILCEDQREANANDAELARVLGPILADPGRLDTMAQAAREQGRPDAAEAVARWLREPGAAR